MRGKATVTRTGLAFAGTPAFARLLDGLDRVERRAPPRLSVLMYHRIEDPRSPAGLDPSLFSATPEAFDEQMAYLAGRRPVLSLHDVLRVRRGAAELPRGAVMVTFDDAYRDFGTYAWPVLRRHGLPVTLFVPTAFPDHPERSFWWDRLHRMFASADRRDAVATPAGTLRLASEADRAAAHRTMREWVKRAPHHEAMAAIDALAARLGAGDCRGSVLSWSELRSLAADGVTLAPHTRTHPLLNRLPIDAARREIADSVADLERHVGTAPPAFAFPAGGLSDELVAWLPEAGFEIAFATERGTNDGRRPDWFRLRRINVGRRSPLPVVRAQLHARGPVAAAVAR